MTYETVINRMQQIVDDAANDGTYEICENKWEKYGKSRIYLSIDTTRKHSTMHKVNEYGYWDCLCNVYVPGKNSVDGESGYSLNGSRRLVFVDEPEHVEQPEPMTQEASATEQNEIVKNENVKKESIKMTRYFFRTNAYNGVAFVDSNDRVFAFTDGEAFDGPVTLEIAKQTDYSNVEGCETAEEIAANTGCGSWATADGEWNDGTFSLNELESIAEEMIEF